MADLSGHRAPQSPPSQRRTWECCQTLLPLGGAPRRAQDSVSENASPEGHRLQWWTAQLKWLSAVCSSQQRRAARAQPSPYHVLGEAIQHALVEDFTWRLWYHLFPLWQETHSLPRAFPVDQKLHFLGCEGWHDKSTELGVRSQHVPYPICVNDSCLTLGNLLSLPGS